MSLIGLTGAHGVGKSTIIKGVREFGVAVIDMSLSRQAQTNLGWTNLKPAEESEENMWALQEMILATMYDRDRSVIESNCITLVDRTPADVNAYVEIWAARLEAKGQPVDRDHVRDFKNRCRAMAAKYTQHIFVPISDAVPFIAEANRADLESRDYHEKSVCQFVLAGGLSHMILLQTGIEERVRRVAIMMNTLQNNKKHFETIYEKENHSVNS